jgi:hypothetical protein
MTTAQQVISTAYAAGITLTVVGGELKIKGKRGDDFDRIVGLLKPVKAAVIDALMPAAVIYSGVPFGTPDPSLEVELTLDASTSDLTYFVGAIVTRTELDILQARVNAKGWSIHTLPAGDNVYVTGLSAQRSMGNILVGGDDGAGNCYYAIKPGSPLYKRFATGKEYKAWLWPKIKDTLDGDADILAELYTIVNAPWVGADIYVDGQHADVVVAAAQYLLNQYSADGLPIFTKGKA